MGISFLFSFASRFFIKKVYNSLANTSEGDTLRPPSDVYVRSFFCPFLYFNKTLLYKSSWVIKWSLILKFNLLLRRSQIQHYSPQAIILGACLVSSGQGKNTQSSSLSAFSVYAFFCLTLLTLQCACVNEWHALHESSEEPCSAVPRWPQ